MEEIELSEQCRLGNNRARKELYEQYAGRMLGICLRYTGDRDTAQYLRKNDVINQSTPLEELPEEYEEPDASDVEAIPQKVLMQFIEELPAGYRTVFNLYTFEDKSHKEIAQVLGINEKSSASQLFRAKSVLAKRVKEWIMHNG